MTGTFVERDCVVEHEGRCFESGGAQMVDCRDGFRRGVVYAKPGANMVTDWHGNKLADATFGLTFQGNFCSMRSVAFVLDGVRFTGRWCPDWADAVKVRSTKRI